VLVTQTTHREAASDNYFKSKVQLFGYPLPHECLAGIWFQCYHIIIIDGSNFNVQMVRGRATMMNYCARRVKMGMTPLLLLCM
jgi:hypothetical protein